LISLSLSSFLSLTVHTITKVASFVANFLERDFENSLFHLACCDHSSESLFLYQIRQEEKRDQRERERERERDIALFTIFFRMLRDSSFCYFFQMLDRTICLA